MHAKWDAQAAVRYLRANAAQLRIDPNRIAIDAARLSNRGGEMLEHGSGTAEVAASLAFDNTGDGQAAIAIGNPDRAAHTAVLVPGVGAELSGMGAK